jgi:hypothetical protein
MNVFVEWLNIKWRHKLKEKKFATDAQIFLYRLICNTIKYSCESGVENLLCFSTKGFFS